jgi:hypothetical protein
MSYGIEVLHDKVHTHTIMVTYTRSARQRPLSMQEYERPLLDDGCNNFGYKNVRTEERYLLQIRAKEL